MNLSRFMSVFLAIFVKIPQVRLVTACDPGESAANILSAQRQLQATLICTLNGPTCSFFTFTLT